MPESGARSVNKCDVIVGPFTCVCVCVCVCVCSRQGREQNVF